ncbi:MAG: RluA family pseudouridine synthase [Pseudomonadota bacterium]
MIKIVAKDKTTLLVLLGAAGYSRTKVKQLAKYRAISVNERPVARPDQELQPGDVVGVKTEKEMVGVVSHYAGLEIIHEDADVIVINKPPGLLTIASETEKVKTAYYRLTEYLNKQAKEKRSSVRERVFIVHRLDQGTSGLLVFARNETAKRALQDGWQEAEKRYGVVVEGIPRNKKGRVESYLHESKALRVYSRNVDDGEGKFAVTDYEVVKEGEEYALLDITLMTGRKNQIRVHMADMGHPVVGDKKYGAKSDPLGRLGLHAYYLAFPHPVTGERMEFTLAMPSRFNSLFQKKTGVKA